jgi:hypothetical protein
MKKTADTPTTLAADTKKWLEMATGTMATAVRTTTPPLCTTTACTTTAARQIYS